VLVRRNPLVILLCLELMLNAANLALIGFARMWGNGDGQIFALIVMVVAACEVTVGLGLIVAMHRRRLPIDVDETAGAAGMSATTCRLAGPRGAAARHDRDRRGFNRLPGRSGGWIGTGCDRAVVRVRADHALISLQGQAARATAS
jgi:NADH-quinone oxidoreductase subunit K